MPQGELYVCDADCLINLHRHFRREAIRALRDWVGKGRLRLPEGVLREIIRGTDDLAKFVKSQKHILGKTISGEPRLQAEIVRLERQYGEKIVFGQKQYGGFWTSKAGRQAADAQVIALARLQRGGVVVSDDRAVKLVSALEGVPCIGWLEFVRLLGLVRPEQLELDLDSKSISSG